MTETIKFLKIREVKSPSRANAGDAGIDFYVPKFTSQFLEDLQGKNPLIIYNEEKKCITLAPQKRVNIPSGILCQMAQPGRALIAANKSGIATRQGLIFGAQVVDYEYQGEIHLSIINTGDTDINITEDMKILQFIETPVFISTINIDETSSIESFYGNETTTRGTGAFGSTDHK